MPKPFYSEGLRFSCNRCSSCCRHEPGFVFLSQEDADSLCAALSLSFDAFTAIYCRWVPAPGNLEVLTLKEKSNYDCIFWGAHGCDVYKARPLQCSAFPFWDSALASRERWEHNAEDCPGMNQGPLHCAEEIEAILDEQHEHPYLTRPMSR